jgi:hypothetical protein
MRPHLVDVRLNGVEDLLYIPVPQRGERRATVRNHVGLE